MALSMGHKGGWFCFGAEATYGTADTRDQKLKLRRGSDSVVKTVERISSEEIPYRYTDDSEDVLGNVSVGGSLAFSCQYEGYELIYKHALGTVSSSQPDVTNDPSTYQNTFTCAETLPTGMSFEIDCDTHEKLVEGGKITRIEWAVDVNGLLICTITIIGEDMTLTTSPTGALSFPTAAFVKYSDEPSGGAVVTYAGSAIDVSNLTWFFDNNLAERRFLGSRLTKEPLRGGKIDVGGSFTAEFDSTSEWDDFVAGTKRALVIQFDGATIDTNYEYMQKFSFDAVKLTEGPMTVDDEGRITVDYTFKAFAEDSSNLEMEILGQSTVDASSL